jgi:flagellar assembly protein FliH
MTAVRKFLFDRSFDAPAAGAADAVAEEMQAALESDLDIFLETVAPPPPAYTEEDLATARTEAYAQGETAGRAAVLQGIEQETLETLRQLQSALDDALRQQAESDRRIERETARLALAMVRRLMPTLADRHGLGEIQGLAEQLFADLLDEPRLIVKAHPDRIEALQEHLDTIARSAGFEGALVFRPEPDFGPADCRIEWAKGGAERLAPAIEEKMTAAVEAFENEATQPT